MPERPCPPEIECMNISLMSVIMCNMLMRNVLAAVEDEYNCMSDLMPTDPKKLVEQLLGNQIKLKLVTSEMKPEDRQIGKGQPEPKKSHYGSRPQVEGCYSSESQKVMQVV